MRGVSACLSGVAGADGDESLGEPIPGHRGGCGEEAPYLEAAGGLQAFELQTSAFDWDDRRALHVRARTLSPSLHVRK